MEVYKSETREVLERFLSRRIGYGECIAALDAALAGVLPRGSSDELPGLRELMLANNAAVSKEMERRAQRPPVRRSATPEAAGPLKEIRDVLQQELQAATERAASSSAAFIEVTNRVPSGLPHPDGTQRIRN